ncbi:MAG TPA: c-type cytochrome [Steroidobacteraceae bacterium]
MNIRLLGAALGAAAALSAASVCGAQTSDPPPAWAFPLNPPAKPPRGPSHPDRREHVPGSPVTYTDRQLEEEFFTPDWFPADHPPLPTIVASGRKPAMPCGLCHLASGNGGPAEAALPGLPASYIVEQVQEFRAGRRAAAQPAMQAAHDMVLEAKAVSDTDLAAAARYFSRLGFISRFHVVETDTAPKVHVGGVSLYMKTPGAGTEPLGERIVEVPDDTRQCELGNAHGDFTAYVPKGSIARGEKLVASGDGAAPCRSCHGPDLTGVGNIPPLAGRSPSYLARQLYDIQHGSRHGPVVAPMLPEVAHITPADRIAIVAYLASLRP